MNAPAGRLRRLAGARLYAITADVEAGRILDIVPALLRGGADVIQLRQKSIARGDLHRLACRLAPLVQAAGALFIVNDHVDIAILSGADGVHLGPDDIPPDAARRIGGADLLIGASAGTSEAALEAAAAGADYLGSGPAFPTPIKPEKRVIGPAGVALVQASVGIPVFAIGGIDPTNLDQLRAAGVSRVCMIRGLFDAQDPEATASAVREAMAR